MYTLLCHLIWISSCITLNDDFISSRKARNREVKDPILYHFSPVLWPPCQCVLYRGQVSLAEAGSCHWAREREQLTPRESRLAGSGLCPLSLASLQSEAMSAWSARQRVSWSPSDLVLVRPLLVWATILWSVKRVERSWQPVSQGYLGVDATKAESQKRERSGQWRDVHNSLERLKASVITVSDLLIQRARALNVRLNVGL